MCVISRKVAAVLARADIWRPTDIEWLCREMCVVITQEPAFGDLTGTAGNLCVL